MSRNNIATPNTRESELDIQAKYCTLSDTCTQRDISEDAEIDTDGNDYCERFLVMTRKALTKATPNVKRPRRNGMSCPLSVM